LAVPQRMYARALFEAARDDDKLEGVAADLSALARALEEVPELRAFLRNPEVEPAGKAEVLDEITAGAEDLVRNFVRLVAEKGRAGELGVMNEEYEALLAREQNRLALELTTAYELSDMEAASIVAAIEKASGRKVEATRTVDPELIGGVVLKVGSFLADGSVRGRLERLRRELSTAH
jgi:F-type H+-transporting ATPase subunit delta